MMSWVVFGGDVFIFLVFGIPLIETVSAKVLVTLCYVSSVSTLVMAAIRATGCDPSDPNVQQQDLQLQEKEHLPYCTTCNCPVFARSKHCRSCNKCVKVFDHHCMWLNNCIGDNNYRAFATCISAVAVMTGIVLHICIYLLVDCLTNEEQFERRLEDYPVVGRIPKEAALGLLGALICINFPLFFLDMQLIILHTFLTWHDLTTYEYIMEKRTVDYIKAGEAHPNKDKQRVLPHCLDWIVYRKKKQKKDKIEKYQPDPPVAMPPPLGADVISETSSAKGHQRCSDLTPTPPGSNADGDSPAHLTSSA